VTNDRAAVVAQTILAIIKQAPAVERRQQIEDLLRQEFADERRQAVADRSLPDE
jgi:hypothetical protein